jgi:hypothetical protein
MDLHLSAEERELLAEVLEERHTELMREIFRTDHHDFRLLLKRKEKILQAIMEKVGVPVNR